MPDNSYPLEERRKLLKEQMEEFLKSGALAEIFGLLRSDRRSIAEKYNGRVGPDGRVLETQLLEPLAQLEVYREQLYPLFAELGFFHINRPLSDTHSRILVLGGALNICFTRTRWASEALKADSSCRSVDGLSCYRPVHPKERADSRFFSSCETEFGVLSDAFSSVFDLSGAGFRERFQGDRNLNRISCVREFETKRNGCAFRVFAAPSTEPSLRRADTGDTLLFYLENADLDPEESLLAVTNNRYCNRQFLQLSWYLLNKGFPMDLDVSGCIPDDQTVTKETYDPFQYLQDLIGILDWMDRFGV